MIEGESVRVWGTKRRGVVIDRGDGVHVQVMWPDLSTSTHHVSTLSRS
ncbi:hypothetical protein SEA_DREAMTEAM1_87 [Mycobacterium phage DreamTeam1]|nr:hypothetical protein SEA_DREAMTEAM1_87 [Mycobacterium phage DreamTeam1]